MSRTNVSYFVSLDALLTNAPAHTIMTGDRNLEFGGKAAGKGLFSLSTNRPWEWTSERHPFASDTAGTFSFADGPAEIVKSDILQRTVAGQPMQVNRIAIP